MDSSPVKAGHGVPDGAGHAHVSVAQPAQSPEIVGPAGCVGQHRGDQGSQSTHLLLTKGSVQSADGRFALSDQCSLCLQPRLGRHEPKRPTGDVFASDPAALDQAINQPDRSGVGQGQRPPRLFDAHPRLGADRNQGCRSATDHAGRMLGRFPYGIGDGHRPGGDDVEIPSPGSLVAYGAFVWLLATSPIQLVASYAYVNPVVAVAVGWLLLDEHVDAVTIVGAGLALASVVVALNSQLPPSGQPDAEGQRGAATASTSTS